MSRRIVAVLAIVVGVGLVVEPFALKLFPRAAAGERVTGRFRQTMSRRGLRDLQANFATVGGFTNQLTHETMPYLAGRLHMTRGQFNRYVQTDFPAVAAGVKEIPPAAAFVGPVIPKLVAAHGEFVAIDGLPGLGLPITSIPWLLIGLGVGLVGVGALALAIPRALPLAALGAIGVAMVVLAFAFSLPGKADDARRIAALGRVALSPQAATKALAATKVIDGTVHQTPTRCFRPWRSASASRARGWSRPSPRGSPRSRRVCASGTRSGPAPSTSRRFRGRAFPTTGG